MGEPASTAQGGGQEAVHSSGNGGSVAVHMSKEKMPAVEENSSIDRATGIGRSLSLLRT